MTESNQRVIVDRQMACARSGVIREVRSQDLYCADSFASQVAHTSASDQPVAAATLSAVAGLREATPEWGYHFLLGRRYASEHTTPA